MEPVITTTNFFAQALRSAEMMAELDAKLAKAVAELQEKGYTIEIYYG